MKPDTFVDRREAARLAGISVSSLKRLEAAGEFPAAIPITTKRRGYSAREIASWQSERIQARDASG